jgi:hypothetical protein
MSLQDAAMRMEPRHGVVCDLQPDQGAWAPGLPAMPASGWHGRARPTRPSLAAEHARRPGPAGIPLPPPLWQALAEIGALLALARIIEPIYGSTEFLRLLLIVATSSSAVVFIAVYLLYLTSPSKDGKVL